MTLPILDRLWQETLGDPRVAIGILDGPVDVAHPAFARADLELVDAGIMPVAREGPAAEHGTHVASVIFAGHGPGPLRGIAPGCRGVIIPVFADGPGGTIRTASQFDLARAIDLAMTRGVSVISISGGQFRPSGAAHPTLADSVRECHRRGILIVAAAGNEGCECLHVPAAMPSVLAVGAMDDEGRPLDFSNWGRAYADQGVLAPGKDVLGAAPGGGFVYRTGTSYATPIVAGIAGLLLSLQLRQGERPDVAAVRSAILRGAVGCGQQPFPDCQRLLAGRLDVERSLIFIMKGSTSMSEAEVVAQEGQVMASAVAQAAGVEPSACTLGPAEVQPARSADVRPSPLISAARPEFMAAGVAPSDCGCGGGNGKECTCGTKTRQPVKVYVIGQVGYDLGTEARRDSFLQAMGKEVVDPQALLTYLKENPYEASRLTWTLMMESVPVYAIQAAGPYAARRQRAAGQLPRTSPPGLRRSLLDPGFHRRDHDPVGRADRPRDRARRPGDVQLDDNRAGRFHSGGRAASRAKGKSPEFPRPRLLRVQEPRRQAGRPGDELRRDQPLPGPGSLRAGVGAEPSARED